MSFEAMFNARNANVFLREFTYGTSRIRLEHGQQIEFCDGAVSIDDLLILYQLKERNPNHATNEPSAESRWFKKKVSQKAVDQLAASMSCLTTRRNLPLVNLRGQVMDLSAVTPIATHKVVIHAASKSLPLTDVFRKGRVSKRIGFVHFFDATDYAAMATTFHTPFEIADYLQFREKAAMFNPACHEVSEKALVGKFLSDTGTDVRASDEVFVDRLSGGPETFNISGLLSRYLDRIVLGNRGTEYHAILVELAKLRRNMLSVFRDRLYWAMRVCREDSIVKPSRIYFPATGCSFIIIALPARQRDVWHKTIQV